LNRGCTPTKTMVASARVAHLARRGEDYGVATGPVAVEMEEVRRRKRTLVESWSSGSRKRLEGTGGFVGLEFGQMFRRFGSRVSILEQAPHLAPREDPDVCRAIHEILEEDGIQLHLQVRATSVASAGEGIRIRIKKEGEGGAGEAEGSLEGSHLLVAAGRVPNTDVLNLGAVGLEVEENGSILVNDRLETGVPGIWALGDVNGGPPFTHVSYDDFRIVRDNLLKGKKASRSGRLLPYTLFIDPELGRVGLTETQAREAGHRVRVATLPMERVARAVERDETRGFIKAVVDAETDRILGAAALAPEGGELAALFQVAMMGDLPYQTLREGLFAHPTMAESLNNLFASLED